MRRRRTILRPVRGVDTRLPNLSPDRGTHLLHRLQPEPPVHGPLELVVGDVRQLEALSMAMNARTPLGVCVEVLVA